MMMMMRMMMMMMMMVMMMGDDDDDSQGNNRAVAGRTPGLGETKPPTRLHSPDGWLNPASPQAVLRSQK
eukprot:8320876-Karenia_brevis.AAC.1